jgi:hypothetical protein
MLAGNSNKGDHSNDLGEDQNTLKWITNKTGVCRLDSSSS